MSSRYKNYYLKIEIYYLRHVLIRGKVLLGTEKQIHQLDSKRDLAKVRSAKNVRLVAFKVRVNTYF